MPYDMDFHNLGNVTVAIGSVSNTIVNPFEQLINNIQQYWDVVNGDNRNVATSGNVIGLLQEVELLKELVQNGHTVGDRTHYVSNRMAKYTETIIMTMQAAGFDFTGATSAADMIPAFQRWQAIAEAGNLLSGALTADQSIQAMIETDYIERGNDVIFEDMAGLKESLNQTSLALELLTDIQNLHNQVQPQKLDLDNWLATNYPGRWGGTWEGFINSADQADITRIYEEALGYVGVEPSWKGLNDGEYSLDEMWDMLEEYRKRTDDIITELGALRGDEELDPDSLEGKLKDIFASLPSERGPMWTPESDAPPPEGTVAAWLIDGMNKYDETGDDAEDRGIYHTAIAEAMTAASNLNDEQKSDLKRVMFVFEEFYKSASAIMSRVTQLLEKMAQNISR